jgi:CTP:molybdopterin cytidylyltransferase MocA
MISTNCNRPPVPRLIVLAAGFSARMGKPKALTRVRGVSLIVRTLETLIPFAAAPVIVVIPPRSSRFRAELRGRSALLLDNPQRGEGLSSSVRRGLRRARYETAALLVPVDLPHLERRDVARLIARWRAARRRIAARRVGAAAAAPLILPRWLYPQALAIGGDAGLQTLVRRLPPGDIALMDLASAAFDVDTPRDLERARRYARPRAS